MTTIFTISTKTFSHTALLLCVLGAAWLLVMVGLQSCRTAAISATALDLNNYQTGRTLRQGDVSGIIQIAYAPSVIGFPGKTDFSSISSTPLAFAMMYGLDWGIAQGFNAGATVQTSFTNFLLDHDGGFNSYLKVALTDTASLTQASLLLSGSILWGTPANTRDVYYGLWPFGPGSPPISRSDTITHSIISSRVVRIGLATPITLATLSPNGSMVQGMNYHWGDMDIVFTPALHFVHQQLRLEDTIYIEKIGAPNMLIPIASQIRNPVQNYLIPSLSAGINWNLSLANIFPEFTVSLVNNKHLTFGFGICVRPITQKP